MNRKSSHIACFGKKWVLAAILFCSTSTLSFGQNCCCCCTNGTTQDAAAEQQVQSTELIRTSQSWDGVELPDYFKGRPELVAVKYVFPAGKKLGWHHHPAMNYGILVQGEHHRSGRQGEDRA